MTPTALVKPGGTAAEAKKARSVESQITAAMADGRDASWRLAEALHAFDQMKGWRRLGFKTLGEWLASPNIGMKRASYFMWVGAWGKLVVERQVDPDRVRALDGSKVNIVVPAITAGTTPVDEALTDAESLGARDLRGKYRAPESPCAGTSENGSQKSERSDSRDISSTPTAKTDTAESGRRPADSESERSDSPPVQRRELRAQLEGLGALTQALVMEEREGFALEQLDAKLATVVGLASQARALIESEAA